MIEKGYDIVFVGIGAGLSGTVQACHLAAMDFPEDRIYIVDSKNLSSASGLLALKACDFRDEGLSAKEIYEKVTALTEKASAQFGVETLDYLNKGGRCSNLLKIMGHMFHIHPIMKVIDGKLIVYKKARGKSQAFYDELVDILKHERPIDDSRVMVTNGGLPDGALDYIIKKLSKYVDPKNIILAKTGAVISSHCGFGTVGILYLRK